MPRPLSLLATAVAGTLLVRERRARRATERFVAAALETLLNAIDANDADTGAHVRRVALYALILADAAGLDERQRRSVERVALFHDIGKVHEALFDIIHDRAEFTPEQQRAIASHPRRGAYVLAPLSAFYPDLAEGVLSHHERWDGEGYPRGLRAEQIPLAARIVAIADTFDVITNGRSYARGQNARTAADILARGRGRQWEPALVDLFLRPDTFERVRAACRRARRPSLRSAERRVGAREAPPSDISFRWRSKARALPPQDPASQEPRG